MRWSTWRSAETGLRRQRQVALGDPRGQLVALERRTKEEALADVAAHDDEPVAHLGVLDALGHHAEAEVAAEVDRRADDRRVAAVRGHADDEGLVDLDLVDRQLLELA